MQEIVWFESHLRYQDQLRREVLLQNSEQCLATAKHRMVDCRDGGTPYIPATRGRDRSQ